MPGGSFLINYKLKMKNKMKKVITNLILLAALFMVMNANSNAQFTQQGPKLVGTDAIGNGQQGRSVSISADGNTAIVGGNNDSSGTGAVWFYTRTGGVWTQQGSKKVGTGAVGAHAYQGESVALSSDGNTAIVGGYGDSSGAGAAWIFIRIAGVWTQQGPKLVGTGAVNAINGAGQGGSVSISSDGNTAVVGGLQDNSNIGAVWVYTRTAGVWTQQGSKLVGTGAVGSNVYQGYSVSLSADGNTVIDGGQGDNSNAGAVWVFIRSAGVWTQQGNKLVGTGATGNIQQGWSVSLSSDGNTAIEGGVDDGNVVGAAWIFIRIAGVWTQQGNKLVGTGAAGNSQQGWSVSISYSGDTAIVGAPFDNSGFGAAWVYTRTGIAWSQQGTKLIGTGSIGTDVNQGWSVSISSDGSTAIIGGTHDNAHIGAIWMYSSTTTGIEEINKGQEGIVVYPNPANSILNIHLSSYTQNETLFITDILGNEVYKGIINGNDNSISISDLSNGIYFYQVKNDKETLQGKFVVEK
jgi:hypothetical protein